MELNAAKDGARRHRTAEEISRLLEEFETSEGIMVKQFCEIRDIVSLKNT